MQIVCVTGLLLVCYVIYTQQVAISSPLLDEQINFVKRRIDAQARTSIPLFRGSNLGIFVRKRPHSLLPERSIIRRRDIQSSSSNEDNILAELLYKNEQVQRRFDDYSENPGPMFGR
ncbi:unnamed protein product [Rotaria sordida]|uniref:Uncharacterized protein n=1 Tax=Rotaria sordida TaxID=392033 RepID=A0A815GNW9_9BILA|nr:unnamed protein product [Rotaria sordida]CAF1065491.1 unnamed protein product [Rotaria sordida]CAF1159269.1 unnamed protein product [Rotaria sordida]CAF1184034.1 unnamed protein product [Rotaria sordida]CAF1342558.1 unnamed protein product [Rotaria sordida]